MLRLYREYFYVELFILILFLSISCNKESDIVTTPPVDDGLPQIEQIVPQGAIEGDKVAIIGKNFSLDKSKLMVLFDKDTVPIEKSSFKSIIVKVPQQINKQSVEVSVIVDGQESNKKEFSLTIIPAPVIEVISPDVVKEGTDIKITGKNFSFNPDELTVEIDGQKVDIISSSETSIKVKAPQSQNNQIAIKVIRNGKSSNEKTINYLQVRIYSDDFDRQDVAPSGKIDNSSRPLGEDWKVMDGKFSIRDNKLDAIAGLKFVKAYILFDNPDVDLLSGEGKWYEFSVDIKAAESNLGYSGIVFNAQEDGRLYYLRTRGDAVQLIKSGTDGVGDVDRVIFTDGNVPNFPPQGSWINMIVKSDELGVFEIKIYNKSSGELIYNKKTKDTEEPLDGGLAGVHYEKFSESADIQYDNMELKVFP